MATARFWILLPMVACLLVPASGVTGVKRAARPKTAIKIPKSRPPVYRSHKHSGPKWRPPEQKKESDFKRSKAARSEFQRANPCPATGKRTGRCPGYVVDHIRPLKRGGPDIPGNMQWQTKEVAKAKDRIE